MLEIVPMYQVSYYLGMVRGGVTLSNLSTFKISSSWVGEKRIHLFSVTPNFSLHLVFLLAMLRATPKSSKLIYFDAIRTESKSPSEFLLWFYALFHTSSTSPRLRLARNSSSRQHCSWRIEVHWRMIDIFIRWNSRSAWASGQLRL